MSLRFSFLLRLDDDVVAFHLIGKIGTFEQLVQHTKDIITFLG
ncbi:Uncharacterised protein [Segatella copri]|nr:Uncharacterised protein [Segatella copri]